MRKSLGQWLAAIEALHPSEIDLGLERIRCVYDRLPQLSPKTTVLTVAGTNGKGSTVKTIEAIAVALGKKVATYTSPHLLTYNERVQVNQLNATDEVLVSAFEEVEAARGETPLTYFEFGTLAALCIFARSDLDWAILEVGLGGRLDAVNIVAPDIAILTSIDMDHESWLGDTREKIGYEKAGIIRRDSLVVCGDADPPGTVLEKAGEARAFLSRGRDFDVEADGFVFTRITVSDSGNAISQKHRIRSPRDLPVLADNFVTGIQAVAAMGESLDEGLISSAAGKIQLAGRQQIIREKPWVLIDVGHNPQAARALAGKIETLKAQLPIARVVCLIGMLADKNHASSLAELSSAVDQWLPVTLNAGSRGSTAEQLSKVLVEMGEEVVAIGDGPVSAYRRLMAQLPEDALLVVFGSFYTVSDILAES